MSLLTAFVTAVVLSSMPTVHPPCISIGGPASPSLMVRAASLIVRATAVEYAVPPANPAVYTIGEPDTVVRFRVREVVKGTLPDAELLLPAYMTTVDDFNDHASPYTFVRPGGRSGSCFANTYRQGADFLIMLGKRGAAFTVDWCPLCPVNEQLQSSDDRWLEWVRRQVAANQAGPAPIQISYEAFMALDEPARRARFAGANADTRAAIMRTHAERWLVANRRRLTDRQVGLVQEVIALVTPALYRDLVDPELRKQFEALEAKLVCRLRRSDIMAAFKPSLDPLPAHWLDDLQFWLGECLWGGHGAASRTRSSGSP